MQSAFPQTTWVTYERTKSLGVSSGYASENGKAKSANIKRRKPPRVKSGLSCDVDVSFYGAYYPDLRDFQPDELKLHYQTNGIQEGRWPNSKAALEHFTSTLGELPPNFDEKVYCNLNPDVKALYGFANGGAIHYLTSGRQESRPYQEEKTQSYDYHLLNLLTNRVNDLPEVRVDATAPNRINVLVPAFDFRSMSAGFFGVFQVARFVSRCGYRVRLVMFDNFYWNEAEFRVKLKEFPGMEHLFDELEIDYIGSRSLPLVVSPNDNCIATVWYSAYFARKIMNATSAKPFLYLIQDYETNFFPGGSLQSMAEESYHFNFSALFSSKPLMLTFIGREIGIFAEKTATYTHFNNACASYLPSEAEFEMEPLTRRLAFYSRPTVNRNMFELGALTLIESYRQGVFSNGNWEFYGVGIGDVTIQLAEGVTVRQMPRMTLKEYQSAIANFDVGLCLMASPHPSLLPFDLAGSGAVVVTNTYGTKTAGYLESISSNIIATRPTLEHLVAGMHTAVGKSQDRIARYTAARNMKYPRDWTQTFDVGHIQFVDRVFQSSRPVTVVASGCVPQGSKPEAKTACAL